jgi:hypothetical protein
MFPAWEESFFRASQTMIRRPDLDVPRRPKKDRPVIHDWTRREPTPRAARAINELGWALDAAMDELVDDLHNAAKRRGYQSFSTLPDNQLSKILSGYHEKIDCALEVLERALR